VGGERHIYRRVMIPETASNRAASAAPSPLHSSAAGFSYGTRLLYIEIYIYIYTYTHTHNTHTHTHTTHTHTHAHTHL